jgi:hypothetical protein
VRPYWRNLRYVGYGRYSLRATSCIRLLCPWHVAEITQCEGDGFNSMYPSGLFTCYGHKISVQYHQLTGLPIIQTAPGVTQYIGYLGAKPAGSTESGTITMSNSNLLVAQRVKPILHKRCNDAKMQQINAWIRHKHFPVDPSIANTPDPPCRACQFRKAWWKAHKHGTGSITACHTYPGAGNSANQMEAGYPGKMLTTRGLPSAK